jgi:hypothetical protein
MKLFKTGLALILLVNCVVSCEKDDICAASTATTPRIVIDFKDIVNRDELKTVNIRVRGIDSNGDQLAVFSSYNATNVSQIMLPLKSNIPNEITESKFELIKDFELNDNGTPDDTSDDFETGDIDIISITYNVNEVYVSAACGFKLEYTEVSIVEETNNWILLTEATTDNLIIQNENSTHYNIFH